MKTPELIKAKLFCSELIDKELPQNRSVKKDTEILDAIKTEDKTAKIKSELLNTKKEAKPLNAELSRDSSRMKTSTRMTAKCKAMPSMVDNCGAMTRTTTWSNAVPRTMISLREESCGSSILKIDKLRGPTLGALRHGHPAHNLQPKGEPTRQDPQRVQC